AQGSLSIRAIADGARCAFKQVLSPHVERRPLSLMASRVPGSVGSPPKAASDCLQRSWMLTERALGQSASVKEIGELRVAKFGHEPLNVVTARIRWRASARVRRIGSASRRRKLTD